MANTTNFNEAIGNVIMRQCSSGNMLKCTVYPAIKSDFYSEVTIVFEYESGGFLTVGVIQRKEGAPCESHS